MKNAIRITSICLGVVLLLWNVPAQAGLWGDFVSSITGSDEAGEAVDDTIDTTNEAVSEGMENAEEKLEQASEMMGDVTGAMNDMQEGVVDNMGGESAAEEARRAKENLAKEKESQKVRNENSVAEKEAAQKEQMEKKMEMIISTQMNNKSSSSGKERTNFSKAPKKANSTAGVNRKTKAPSTSGRTKTADRPKVDIRSGETRKK